jgi:hypothetical protein
MEAEVYAATPACHATQKNRSSTPYRSKQGRPPLGRLDGASEYSLRTLRRCYARLDAPEIAGEKESEVNMQKQSD